MPGHYQNLLKSGVIPGQRHGPETPTLKLHYVSISGIANERGYKAGHTFSC